jgi:multiple sugar transport system permease protein
MAVDGATAAPAPPEAEPPRAPGPGGFVRAVRGTSALPYWLILPTIVYLAIFFAYPMYRAFVLAFRDTRTGEWTLRFVQSMVTDAMFGEAVWFTLLLLLVILPTQFILALLMALVVNAHIRGRSFLLYIYAIPLAVSELAAGIVWLAIWTERGYLNTILEALGVIDRAVIWLHFAEPSQLLLAVVAAEVWRATSLIMIILVAGLQAIPNDYLEAAEVYGANTYQRVRRVILPMLKPSIQVALILRTILAFQVFATVVVLAGRGATVLTAEAWRWHTQFLNANIAAAYAALILVLCLVSTAIILWALRTPPEQRLTL